MSAPKTAVPRPLVCPECRDGKHGNCPGWAFDQNDREVDCPCPHESHQRK